MKKFLIIYSIAVSLIFILGFTAKKNEDTKNSAKVESVNGVYVFYKSTPVKEYTYLGTVDCPMIIKNYKGSYLVELMVKRAKEKHNSCNAVIFKNEDLTQVDAVTIN